MIEITVNNQSHSISEKTSILELIREIKRSQNGIAVAINEKVIPKSDWENHQIKPKDQILIIQATQGG